MSFEIRSDKTIRNGAVGSILPSYRTGDDRIAFNKLVENICRTTGGNDSADSEVDGAHF